MSNIEREALAAALLGYWGRPRNGQHGPADWTPRQYEVMAEALEASGLLEQLRGAVEALRAIALIEPVWPVDAEGASLEAARRLRTAVAIARNVGGQ